MTRLKFFKLSGWAFIIGSFAFITILNGSIAGSVISSVLLAIGMLGIRARYGENAGSFGRTILLVGVVGMVLAYIAVPIFRENKIGSLLPYAGPAVLLTGLTIFGLVALVRKPMPHVNWLPFVAGVGFPSIYFTLLIFAIMNDGTLPVEVDNYWTMIAIVASLQFLGLCILGFIFLGDVSEDTAVAV